MYAGALRLRTELEAKKISLAIAEVAGRAAAFKNKFDDCVARVERLRSEISNDSFFKSVAARSRAVPSVEELLLEYGKRLCREAATNEALINWPTSELLYRRALCVFDIIAAATPTDDEQLYVSHFVGLVQRRLQHVLDQSARAAAAPASPLRTSFGQAAEVAAQSLALVPSMSVSSPPSASLKHDSPLKPGLIAFAGSPPGVLAFPASPLGALSARPAAAVMQAIAQYSARKCTCGVAISPSAKFCPECGADLRAAKSP